MLIYDDIFVYKNPLKTLLKVIECSVYDNKVQLRKEIQEAKPEDLKKLLTRSNILNLGGKELCDILRGGYDAPFKVDIIELYNSFSNEKDKYKFVKRIESIIGQTKLSSMLSYNSAATGIYGSDYNYFLIKWVRYDCKDRCERFELDKLYAKYKEIDYKSGKFD